MSIPSKCSFAVPGTENQEQYFKPKIQPTEPSLYGSSRNKKTGLPELCLNRQLSSLTASTNVNDEKSTQESRPAKPPPPVLI